MISVLFKAAILCAAILSFAQDKTSTKMTDRNHERMQLHDQMAKAHLQAAECLRSGKSEEECRKAFQNMCKEIGGPEKCRPWMMHSHMGAKGQQL